MLRRLLEEELNLTVIGEAVSAEDALAQLGHESGPLTPDLVLSDLTLPGESGAALTRHLGETRPELRCVIISADDNPANPSIALAAGALDFVLKDDLDRLLRVVREALTA